MTQLGTESISELFLFANLIAITHTIAIEIVQLIRGVNGP